MERNGHAARNGDLERFASLGIRAIRYPVLWERTAPDGLDKADWSWPDERLPGLQNLGVKPIVGLVHHGSGPRHTSLIDPAFAEQLAEFAGAVARPYSWVEYYTPVNEPLTIAPSAEGQRDGWHRCQFTARSPAKRNELPGTTPTVPGAQ